MEGVNSMKANAAEIPIANAFVFNVAHLL